MAKTSLPPGFRFHPTDVELVKYYLKRKVMGKKLCFEAIAEVDIYKYAPWDLPDKSCMRSRDLKWYFFCPREKKYSNGARMNRVTEFGYWKTTGKDRPVHYNNEAVGMIKTLVFHRGKAPRGERTNWVMHEYRIEEKDLADRGVVQDAYVLCVVFQKDGPGPRNGAQYGAPFREEEWDDDDDDVNCVEVVSSAVLSTPVPNQVVPLAASSIVPEGRCIGSSESCLSDAAIPSAYKVLPPVTVGNDVPTVGDQFPGEDDMVSMFDIFMEDSTTVPTENGLDKNHDNEHNENVEATPLDGVDIYQDLADLGNLGGVCEDLYDFMAGDNIAYNMEPYIELHDLDAPLNGTVFMEMQIKLHGDVSLSNGLLQGSPYILGSGKTPCPSKVMLYADCAPLLMSWLRLLVGVMGTLMALCRSHISY
ncbi:hypothetical protein EZV62_014929 [Acer yangbiense]|uniref:NAC domain-containing protein n=1 Tax=Acer yangbiense TaxID=1000413 RepID=A0A5C7HVL8_9ROSI|nr:hypothetical protein EZV62_014929 [Acer yangbiense]